MQPDFDFDNQIVPTLNHVVGQTRAVNVLRTALDAYFNERLKGGEVQAFPHLLMCGPTVQIDGGMVGVGHLTSDENGRITLHCLPVPLVRSGISLDQSLAFLLGQPIGKLTANVNGGSTDTIKILARVWLASTTTKWFVSEDQL